MISNYRIKIFLIPWPSLDAQVPRKDWLPMIEKRLNDLKGEISYLGRRRESSILLLLLLSFYLT